MSDGSLTLRSPTDDHVLLIYDTSVLHTSSLHKSALSKLKFRILPMMFCLSFVSYLDRTNLAFVADDLQASLDLSDKVYGIGAGFFFVSYSTMQMPSNRLLTKFGGVTWIATLAVLWGLSTVGMALINSEISFYLVRMLLGLFEAGFYPGTMVYLRSFFSESDFGFVYAVTMSATSIALAMGGPVIAGIEAASREIAPDYDTWRSCFLVQGGLAVICGVVLFLFQPREIDTCKFLTEEQKAVEKDVVRGGRGEDAKPDLIKVLKSETMWWFAFSWMVFSLPYWGFIYWAPKIIGEIEDDGVSSTMILMISSIPYTGAVLGNVLIARGVEYCGGGKSRLKFLLFADILGASGFAICALASDKNAKIFGLAVAGAGLWGNYAPMWSIVTAEGLSSADKNSYVALVNGIGTIGGMLGPYAVAAFSTREESFWFFCVCCLAAFPLFKMGCLRTTSGSKY